MPAAEPAPVIIPTPAIRSYLRLFQCVALVVTDDRVTVSLDPFTARLRPDAVWWVHSAAEAIAVKEQCERKHHADVVSVAKHLHIALTSNTAAIARAEQAIARLNVLVAQAKEQGLMRCLNARYREERMRARSGGRGFPPYATIHKKFVQSLLRIASGEVPLRSLVDQALGLEAASKPDQCERS